MASLVSNASCALAIAWLTACSRPSPAPAPAPSPSPAASPSPAPAASPSPAPVASSDPAPSPAPFASQCKGITLTIALAGGQNPLVLGATLANQGTEPVALVRTADGSSGGHRNPTMSFELRPDTPVPPGRCGLMNAYEDADFVTLQPGAKQKLEWIYAPEPAKPGRYTLRATYRNDPNREDPGAKLTEEQRTRHRATMPCEVTSNAITFDWNGRSARTVGAR